MSADVEMHLVLAIPLEVDDDGTVIHAGIPYLVDENPFPVGLMGELYDPETGRWRDSTEAEDRAAGEAVEEVLRRAAQATPDSGR